MKRKFPHSFKVYLPLVVVFAVVLALLPRSRDFNYDFKKGSPWMYETLIAQFDFPILKTESQLFQEREKAASAVAPYYKYMEDVEAESLAAFENIRLGRYDALKPQISKVISNIYTTGVLSDMDEASKADSAPVIFIKKGRRAEKFPATDIYRVASAQEHLAGMMRRLGVRGNVDSLCLYSGLDNLITPNLQYDQQTTELLRKAAVADLSPTSGLVHAGQLIVSNGEIITSEIEQLLNSYKAEYNNSLGYSGSQTQLWIGNVLLVIVMVFLLFFTIYYTNNSIFSEFNRYAYLLLVFLIATAATFFVEKSGNLNNIYLVPFGLIALYLVAFFKTKVVYPVYIVSLLPLLIFAHNGIELFVMYFVAGVVAIFSFSYFHRGWQQFLTAFFVYLSLLLTFVMFRLIDGTAVFADTKAIYYMALGSFFTVAGYPLIFLFERIFMLVSTSRLVELSDTNNRLLRELADKAPGTFQHSLQVMNMADAAARAIDANVALVRCGALYHDIGKTLNPLCFIENETPGSKYHEGLTPLESAKDIIKHVSDGLALADKAGLPQVIKDFIVTHHGTSCAAFFYNKYIEQGGDSKNASDFYYEGRKATTKEQSILMLCDTIEAASRSLRDFSPEAISNFVENMFNAKINGGQLDEADISIKELHVLKEVLKDYLQQVHHGRVAYPKRALRR